MSRQLQINEQGLIQSTMFGAMTRISQCVPFQRIEDVKQQYGKFVLSISPLMGYDNLDENLIIRYLDLALNAACYTSY